MSDGIMYFIVSLMWMLLMVMYIVNVYYYLRTKMNIMGELVEQKSIGYKKYQSFSSKKGRTAAWVVLLCSGGNLLIAINNVLQADGNRVLAVSADLIITAFALSLIAVKEKIKSRMR